MRVPDRVQTHPNATVATLTGSLTVVLVWVVGAAGLVVPAEVASAATTLIAAGILAFGRRRPEPSPRGPATTTSLAAIGE
jgi:hypothetical protein